MSKVVHGAAELKNCPLGSDPNRTFRLSVRGKCMNRANPPVPTVRNSRFDNLLDEQTMMGAYVGDGPSLEVYCSSGSIRR